MDRTPRWIMVERSLVGPGNHHYEYVLHMARAACAAGFEVVVAGNRRMNPASSEGIPATIRTTFHHTTYDVDGSITAAPAAHKKYWARLVDLLGLNGWKERRRQQYAEQFAQELIELLSDLDPSRDDHVFFPTLSVAELEGLARVWAAGAGRPATWHLQFHFELPEAAPAARRAPSTGDSSLIDPIARDWFCDAIRQGETYRMLFYCPTGSMAERYNALGAAPFQELPYPVGVIASPKWSGHYPLRITCAGHARRDKGRAGLAELAMLLRRPLTEGIIQLWLQGSRHKFRSLPSSLLRHAGAIRFVPHPLPAAEYARLVAATDIGLFLYDPRTYRRRCSGVLVEMLAAGVPVVVPADTWLAEQIEPAGASVFHNTAVSVDWSEAISRAPGRVGAVAGDVRSFAAAIIHIVHHYQHYRDSAAQFAVEWRKYHSAEHVLQIMLENARKCCPTARTHPYESNRVGPATKG